MSQYDPKKIEEYQLILINNPRSPVFAALAEAYRKMGLLEEALEVTQKGIKHNPEFVSGLVAHAKVLYELKDYRQAVLALTKAHALKPENLLALRLLGHSYLKLRNHHEALRTFKKLLIISPNDSIAIGFIEKWEFLENIPSQNSPEHFQLENSKNWVQNLPSVKQALHIIDSFMNYGDMEAAYDILHSALSAWTDNDDLKQRQKLIETALHHSSQTDSKQNSQLQEIQFKKEFYQRWLQRIEQSKRVDHPTEP